MTRTALVVSVQVGQPRTLGVPDAEDVMDRPWTSAIHKTAVEGARHVGALGLDGDAQADLTVHGGPNKALLVYAVTNYPFWRDELPHVQFQPGSFGENLTVDGVAEPDVAIGDIWRVGSSVCQVSQPRQPCWKLARHLRVPDMVVRVRSSGRTGWYLRVLEEGSVEPGADLELLERPHPEWTVERATRTMFAVSQLRDDALRLAGLEELSESWREALRLRADPPPTVEG